jgi:hypothetical protein
VTLCKEGLPDRTVWLVIKRTVGAPLSGVGFLKAVMISMFLPSRMSLSLPLSETSGGQGYLHARQERGLLL